MSSEISSECPENDSTPSTSLDDPHESSSPSLSNALRLSSSSDEAIPEEDQLTTSLLPNDATTSESSESRTFQHRFLKWTTRNLRKLGPWLAYISLFMMLILIPCAIYRAAEQGSFFVGAWDTAGVMVVGTVVMSLRLVYLHLTHWHMPDVQKYVVRILWMVPIYTIQSWLSLRFHEARIYIDAIRDCYEAYVIASFVYFLMEVLGGQDKVVEILVGKNDPSLGRHQWPLSYVMQPWEMGTEFMLQAKHGALQYVVVKLIATIVTILCQLTGMYGEGSFSLTNAYPYLTFILNISVMYALYCLVMLYHAVNDELCNPVNWRPLGKFLCVKGVVFFTWWQGVIIFYLRAHGFIKDVGNWSSNDVANGLIDYCVCVEMVFFALAHSYTFAYTDFLPTVLPPPSDNASYQPPAIRTLERPQSFRDALWSSTVPKETINDIQRLRGGVEQSVALATDPGAIDLRPISSSESNESTNNALV